MRSQVQKPNADKIKRRRTWSRKKGGVQGGTVLCQPTVTTPLPPQEAKEELRKSLASSLSNPGVPRTEVSAPHIVSSKLTKV